MPEILNYKNHIVIGTNSTGKSTFVKTVLLPDQQQAGVMPNLVIHPLSGPVWQDYKIITVADLNKPLTGNSRIVISADDIYFTEKKGQHPANRVFSQVIKYVRYCNIVVDDCRVFLNSNLPRTIAGLQADFKNMKCNLVYIFHSVTSIQNGLMDNFNGNYYLFYTGENTPEILDRKGLKRKEALAERVAWLNDYQKEQKELNNDSSYIEPGIFYEC